MTVLGYNESENQFIIDFDCLFGGICDKIHFPTLEGMGNHDFYNIATDGFGWPFVFSKIKARNPLRDWASYNETENSGATLPELERSRLQQYSYEPNDGHYSWTWDDVRFVQLNEYAGGGILYASRSRYAHNALKFLANDLATNVGTSGAPVVIVQHYGLKAIADECSVAGGIEVQIGELEKHVTGTGVLKLD